MQMCVYACTCEHVYIYKSLHAIIHAMQQGEFKKIAYKIQMIRMDRVVFEFKGPFVPEVRLG